MATTVLYMLKQFKLTDKTDYSLTNWLFLRSLALIYCLAFVSLGVQVIGLFGSNGILPAESFLKTIATNLGIERYCLLPTIFWFNASDTMLMLVCTSGMVISLLAFSGICTAFCFLCLWFLYLSLANIGQDFLSFQWDALLLEVGFLAIFLAPWQWLECPWQFNFGKFEYKNARINPSVLFVWLTRWLLFRLMFESGLVKLASGDNTWRNLTALNYHYFTQPLPTPLAWFMAQMPDWFHSFNVICVFVIELLVPFLIFFGRKPRSIAAFVFVGLQIVIAANGNYAYFNLLTITLCIYLLDDECIYIILALLSKSLLAKYRLCNYFIERLNSATFSSTSIKPSGKIGLVCSIIAAIFIMAISIGSLARGFVGLLPIPAFFETLHDISSPYFIANSYGLFAVMTTKRPEVIIEGSNDGITWQAYEFKYKPGILNKALPIVAPHQPRLDWQMWFAALNDTVHDRWFINFIFRLLQGQKEVLDLLAKNPFPINPPKYIRAQLYDYNFTNFGECRSSGNWWKRELIGEYMPTVNLENKLQ